MLEKHNCPLNFTCIEPISLIMKRNPCIHVYVVSAVLFALTLFSGPISLAAEFRLIDDFHDVATVVDAFATRFGPQNVLLVLDIDNTLLAMDEPLGSEQWFDWQVYLLKNEPHSPHLVADSFRGILDVQGRLYNLGTMHPTQPDLPTILAKLQDRGVSAVVLTSRGDDFRPATERELTRNGFDFARSALPTRDERGSLYMPFDPARPAAAGIDARAISTLKLAPPQPVSFSNGIMMTSGQHKGIMLVTLLHRAARQIKAVVIVDNRADHVAGVCDQMLEEGLEVAGLVYQREDDSIKAFQYGSKDEVTSEWRMLERRANSRACEAEITITAPRRCFPCVRQLRCR
jgi:Protein of unknown function (DUF2608)